MTTARAVPEGLSEAQLDRALEAFRGVVGSDHVLTGDEALEFRDPFWHSEWPQYDASAVVQPSSAEEVQAIVRLAGEHGVPIWTTSQGRNNGYGGSSPRVRGSVVMNLRRMNRVLEINEELGYAVVEPGVRWTDLNDAIQAGGHRLMLTIPDLGWGSVIGNALEHGITYMPYGADFMAPCGMEVVLADGELLRTGMGALPGSKTWHLYRRGLGPTLDPLFMQSNFGVVVKMGVWLMPWPETFVPIWLNAPKETDLIPIIDTTRRLRLDRTLEGVPRLYNTLVFASLMDQRSRWYDGDGPTPDHIIDQVAGDLGFGRWTMSMALWDDNVIADYKIDKIKAAFEQIPGVQVRFSKHAPEEIPALENHSDRVLGGAPAQEWNNILRWYGSDAGAHLGNGLIAPLDGQEAFRLHSLIRGVVEREMGLDYFASPMVINARSLIHACGAIWDISSEEDSRRAYAGCRAIVEEAAKAGFGEYRAHLDYMDLAADKYSFGDHAYRRFLEKIKDAVDPKGILSPGKQSIWPASYRPDKG
ncbi:FAD-binding oxidoreductase [Streptomyces phaeochromogenes]|uniref:FAD-binding oxidoreductase n=1 Tax=Streptomyces phaeochromogenes TaxID=1923 RepID=UPI0033DBAF85